MGYDHNRIKENARLFYKNNTGNSILSQLIYYGVLIGVMIEVKADAIERGLINPAELENEQKLYIAE